jgi:sugar/nucleoside kinase (ribokinase family)
MTAQSHLNPDPAWGAAIGVGGIGTGLFFALEGNEPLGRNESRPGRLLEVKDYCKLHIVAHHLAVLLGAGCSPFSVLPVGKVGDDAVGGQLLEEMADAGMDTRFVDALAGVPTLLSVCFQFPDGAGGNITTSESAAAALTTKDIDRAVASFGDAGSRIVVIAMPEVPLFCRQHLLETEFRRSSLRVAAFTSSEMRQAYDSGTLKHVDLLSMNEDEAQTLVGMTLDPAEPAPFLDACRGILSAMPAGAKIIVTAGPDGAFALDAATSDYCPAAPVTAASTAGAGDALLGGVVAGLVAGLPFVEPSGKRRRIADRPISSAFDLGCLTAAYTVTSPHTIHPELSLGSLLKFAERLGIPLAPSILRRGSSGEWKP